MQAVRPFSRFGNGRFSSNLGYFFLPPIVAIVLVVLLLAVIVTGYQGRHTNRVFTGVAVGHIDLSGMTREEAKAALSEAFTYTEQPVLMLKDPATGQQWLKTPAELGLRFDLDQTVTAAYQVGRSGNPFRRLQEMFTSWYYGRSLGPVLVFDENQFNAAIASLTAEINHPPANATLVFDGQNANYIPGQTGRVLDVAELRQRLLDPISQFQPAEIDLLVHEIKPAVYDETAVAAQIQNILKGEPVTFYLQEPLDDLDLQPIELPAETLKSWLRVEMITNPDGTNSYHVFLDENAAREWLSQYAPIIHRDPVNARFYFDDDTRELVLVAPHINGRELDIEATLNRLQQQIGTPDHAIPFVIREITPTVHADATAAELGITELISEKTTWFRGSTDARKHNIARAAANFYGIVIAPGEEFSFNKYLGTISEADGYAEGLIIVGGRTIRGIGGGVCQVSTTMFQTAFWAGFPITERWEHGYMLGYYNDGEGPGMDATVFSPIVDFRFINNTPYHLLIENYYNEEEESLTFKFYSTSLGRTVVKEGPIFEDIVPAPTEDVWQFDETLEPGTVEQIDWATEGARVTVNRTVYNANGDLILQDSFVSNYIPWPNVFNYGPGVNAPDYSLVPDDH
ncbi:MAG: hypothetical protein D6706_00655 [Chloroflexi bacterium]|nr:MAG: hypothetical protein D6706_00655 [Chloroflexota bacterium]